MEELRRYELYVIFQPELDDEQLEGQIDRTNGYLTGNGGEIIEVARKGKRRLEYPIKRYNQGIDVIYQTYLPTSSLETLERQLNLNEDVVRYLIVRRDDLAGEERLVASEEEVEAAVAELQATPAEIELQAEAAGAEFLPEEETAEIVEGEERAPEELPTATPEATGGELVEEDISMMEGPPSRAYVAEAVAVETEEERDEEEGE
ncbi:MAG: 30S ribosomal protein S6 [Chloroflexota bacterium]|nr:30S ribosomal protein S6 [Chloroflexota bacterium]